MNFKLDKINIKHYNGFFIYFSYHYVTYLINPDGDVGKMQSNGFFKYSADNQLWLYHYLRYYIKEGYEYGSSI